MSQLVVDASAVLAWLLPDQANARTRNFVAGLDDYDLSAPAVFEWEVLNVLLQRRGPRLSEQDFQEALLTLDAFQIELRPPVEARSLLDAASAAQLSLFDFSYLELALDEGAELVSRDHALVAAGERAGLRVHDLSERPRT